MIKTDNIYFYLIVLTIIATVVSPVIFKSIDELIVLFLVAFVSLDILVNRRWKDYILLYIMVGLMLFYAVMSIIQYNFNTPKAIFYDFVLQLKPLLPFAICYVALPKMSMAQKK